MKKGFGFKSMMVSGTMLDGYGEYDESTIDYSKPVSAHNGEVWTLGEWKELDNDLPLEPCKNGYHFMRENGLYDWGDLGTRLYIVEVSGPEVAELSKSVVRRMRVVKHIPVTVGFLARYGASHGRSVLGYSLDDDSLASLHLIWSILHRNVSPGHDEAMELDLAGAILREYAPEYL